MDKSNLDEIDTNHSKSDLITFLSIIKKLLINPIISVDTPEEIIKEFANNLGELFVFFWRFALNIKDSVFIFLKESNSS